MFSSSYNEISSRVTYNLSDYVSNVYNVINKIEPLTAYEAASLLNVNNYSTDDIYKSILEKAKLVKESSFCSNIFPVVPLYVSSICSEQCLYCNYRADNKVKVERHRLSDDELLKEVDFLIHKKGYRAIELVYSTDLLFRVDSICKHIELLRASLEKAGGGVVGLSAEPFTENEYRLLKSAGVDFSVLWQETYDQEVYEEMHPGTSKKSDFNFRVDAYDRMAMAGIEHIGIGVLSGLADWRKDWGMLFMHQEYLKNTYGIKPPIIGMPRLKPSAGAIIKKTSFIPSDEEFLLCAAVQCLFDPQSLPFVNTRENWDLCLKLSSGGGVLFTFNCSTMPGGYSLNHKGYQFPTFDFDIDAYRHRAEDAGLKPTMNWAFPETGR